MEGFFLELIKNRYETESKQEYNDAMLSDQNSVQLLYSELN